MVSLRKHKHLRLCAGRTCTAQLPWFCDNRTAQNSSHVKPKSVHPVRLSDVNQPEGNLTATGASAEIFTNAVLALPAFATMVSESGHSPIWRLHSETDEKSLGANISRSIQVTPLQSQVKEPESCTLQLENQIDRLQAMANKLQEESTQQNGELDNAKVESEKAEMEMLEFDNLLLQTIENVCGNLEIIQKVDLVMGEPNQMHLRELLQKVEKLHENVSSKVY